MLTLPVGSVPREEGGFHGWSHWGSYSGSSGDGRVTNVKGQQKQRARCLVLEGRFHTGAPTVNYSGLYFPASSSNFHYQTLPCPLLPKVKQTNKQKMVIPWEHLSHTQFIVLQWKLAWPWWKQGRLTPNPGFHLHLQDFSFSYGR